MVRSRHRKTRLQKVKNLFWPQLGWKRYAKYLTTRLSRLGGSSHSIAAGVACGVAVSFTPFVGFHFVLAAVSAWIFRANIMASAIGTAAGNPWSFPIIWLSVLYSGRIMLGQDLKQSVNFAEVFESGMHALITFDFSSFGKDVWPVVWPMMVGCVPFYIIAWTISYILVKRAIDKVNLMRQHQRKERKV